MINITDIANILFAGLVLTVSIGVSSHVLVGFENRKFKDVFVSLFLLMIVAVQLYFVVQAVVFIPAFPYSYKEMIRVDCLNSGKGGKRPRGSERYFDYNPCFCHSGAECYDISIGEVISTDGSCPKDGKYGCKSPAGDEISLYINDDRNCRLGQGNKCTKSEPCHPCNRDDLPTWKSGRCQSCAIENTASCNFVPGVGPYCLESPDSLVVVPCKTCCTDPVPLFVNNTCY